MASLDDILDQQEEEMRQVAKGDLTLQIDEELQSDIDEVEDTEALSMSIEEEPEDIQNNLYLSDEEEDAIRTISKTLLLINEVDGEISHGVEVDGAVVTSYLDLFPELRESNEAVMGELANITPYPSVNNLDVLQVISSELKTFLMSPEAIALLTRLKDKVVLVFNDTYENAKSIDYDLRDVVDMLNSAIKTKLMNTIGEDGELINILDTPFDELFALYEKHGIVSMDMETIDTFVRETLQMEKSSIRVIVQYLNTLISSIPEFDENEWAPVSNILNGTTEDGVTKEVNFGLKDMKELIALRDALNTKAPMYNKAASIFSDGGLIKALQREFA